MIDWLKNKIKAILIFTGFLGVVLAAPVIPEGNGQISVAIFENEHGQKVYLQLDDEQYEKMMTLPGVANNPQDHDGLIYTGTSYGYPVEEYKRVLVPASATTTEVLNPQPEFQDIDGRKSLFNVLIPEADAAVGFDAVLTRANGAGTTLTSAFTIDAAATVVIVYSEHPSGSSITATYAGDSMTRIHNAVDNNVQLMSSFILIDPKTGTNNVVTTRTGGAADQSHQALSYSGVVSAAGTGGSDADAQLVWASGGGDRTLTTTTVTDGAWITLFHRTQNAYTEGTNVTYRDDISGVANVSDTNGAISPAGATNQTIEIVSGSGSGGMISVVVAPEAVVSGWEDIIIID